MRRGLVVLALAMCVLFHAASAGAKYEPIKYPPRHRAEVANGRPAVAVGYDGAGNEIARTARRVTGNSGGSETSDWSCGYYEQSTRIGLQPGPDLDRPATIEVGGHYWLQCIDATGQQVYLHLITWDPANPFGPMDAGWRASGLAEAQITLPDPAVRTSPPADGAQLVGLETWLWLDGPWTPLTATATLGGVSATVTATPVEVVWDPGDGEPPIVCPNAGTPYDPDHPDRAPPCSHTYHWRSTVDSPTGTYPLRATVTWRIEWTSTDGDSGTLPDLTRTTTVPLLVQEAQALIE